MLKDILRQIHIALEFEEKNSFTNFKGKEKYFADFIQESLFKLKKELSILMNNGFLYSFGEFNKCLKEVKFYSTSAQEHRIVFAKRVRQEIHEIALALEKYSKSKNSRKITGINLSNNLWETSVNNIQGVSPKIQLVLNKLNIYNVYDLLTYYPHKHVDYSTIQPIKDLKQGQNVSVVGQVNTIHVFNSPKNPNLYIATLTLRDGTGAVSINKFIYGKTGKFLSEKFRKDYTKGSLVLASGTVNYDKKTRYQLTNYNLELLQEYSEGNLSTAVDKLNLLIPVYNLTEGLNSEYLRKLIKKVLSQTVEKNELELESLPANIIQDNELYSLKQSINVIHFPKNKEQLAKAEERLAFEEFFFLQLPLAIQSYKNKQNIIERNNIIQDNLVQRFLDKLPFSLTNAQNKVFNEILNDLQEPSPMNRLIQGDVGSGKTVIAILTMLIAIERGGQAALMAPTEILSEQHYLKTLPLLTELGLKVALLTGSQKTKVRREVLQGLANGQIHLVIGTHALIQDSVEFNNLQLAVIDEQHRFGVKQREKLREKGALDCLFMTATPIPRTLALSLYGNLDLSEINELPPGRKPIHTTVMKSGEKKKLYKFIKEQIKEGRQAYIVFPLIEESETLSAKAVTEEAEKIKNIFKESKIGIIHGKLAPDEKEHIMNEFRKNNIQILLGTTVIEVGVDVPNATIMIIENAERFGLAQLHQLRGRVGRGAHQSYCFLVSEKETERLVVMEETENGFVIAQKDMELRGAGEIIGTRQSGMNDYALSKLITHAYLLEPARQYAKQLIDSNPELNNMSKLFDYKYQNISQKVNIS